MRTPQGPWKVALWIAGTRLLAEVAMVLGTYWHRSEPGTWPHQAGDLFYRQVPIRALDVWGRWDTDFYLAIARNAYPPLESDPGWIYNAAFFPLYPALMRGLSVLLGGANLFYVGLFIANAMPRVELFAVDDADAGDAFEQRGTAGGQLGDHSGSRRAAGDHLLDAGRVEHCDRLTAIVEHARRAAGDHEVARAKRRRDAARHDVGVDVENARLSGRSRFRDAEARDDRHVTVHQQQLDQRGIRIRRVAHFAQIDDSARRRAVRRGSRRTAKSGIDTGQADSRHSACDQCRDELGVRRARKHRHDHVERRAIRDAKAVHFLRRDRAAIELRVNRPAAAVNQHERPVRGH